IAEPLAVGGHALAADLDHRLGHIEANGAGVRIALQQRGGQRRVAGADIEDSDGGVFREREEVRHQVERLQSLRLLPVHAADILGNPLFLFPLVARSHATLSLLLYHYTFSSKQTGAPAARSIVCGRIGCFPSYRARDYLIARALGGEPIPP